MQGLPSAILSVLKENPDILDEVTFAEKVRIANGNSKDSLKVIETWLGSLKTMGHLKDYKWIDDLQSNIVNRLAAIHDKPSNEISINTKRNHMTNKVLLGKPSDTLTAEEAAMYLNISTGYFNSLVKMRKLVRLPQLVAVRTPDSNGIVRVLSKAVYRKLDLDNLKSYVSHRVLSDKPMDNKPQPHEEPKVKYAPMLPVVKPETSKGSLRTMILRGIEAREISIELASKLLEVLC
jgi:hypothetical protein